MNIWKILSRVYHIQNPYSFSIFIIYYNQSFIHKETKLYNIKIFVGTTQPLVGTQKLLVGAHKWLVGTQEWLVGTQKRPVGIEE